MGNCLAGTFTRIIVESFVDDLQKDGLKQLAPKKWNSNHWHSNSTFGNDYTKNRSYKTLVDALVKPFKEGMALAGNKQNIHMEDYATTYLAHHVMKCLLKAPEAPMPEVQVTGLLTDNTLHRVRLPSYNPAEILAFQERWTTLPNGNKLDITTKDNAEQEVLSALLANRIITIVKVLDVAAIIRASLNAYIAQKDLESRRRHELFAASGPAKLEADRKEYTDKEQRRDLQNQIKADLRTATPADIAEVVRQARL